MFYSLSIATLVACLPALARPAERLVSTSPQNTEVLFQLGRGPEVVGTSEWTNYPPEARHLPTVGPLFFPSLERTLLLKPTRVISESFTTPDHFQAALRARNIATEEWSPHSIAELMKLAGREGNDGGIEPWQSCVRRLQLKQPVKQFRFIALTWYEPLILFGQKSFLSDVISQVGGINLAPNNTLAAFPQVSPDWFIEQRPQVVYLLSMGTDVAAFFRSKLSEWWPEHPPIGIALDPDRFGRASFTPLAHLKDLLPPGSAFEIPKVCDAK